MRKRKSLTQEIMDITVEPYFEFLHSLLDAGEWLGEKHKKQKRKH